MSLTVKEKQDIKRQGFARTGGIPRQTYYTPDGRQIQAIPSIRQYNTKDESGEVTGTGTRDANLDNGWSLTPPKRKKPYCAGCDNWHNTKEEVIKCIAQKQETAQKWNEWANKQQASEAMERGKELEELKLEVLELRGELREVLQALKEAK